MNRAGSFANLVASELVRDPAGVEDGGPAPQRRRPRTASTAEHPTEQRPAPAARAAAATPRRSAASAPPTRSNRPNHAPSATRSARGSPSSTSAGRVKAQTATRPPGTTATTASRADSTRSRRSQSQTRDAEHSRGHAGSRGREQHGDDRGVCEHGAARAQGARPARVGGKPEREDEQHVGGERERVPVADRVSQPGRAAAVREEPRDRLARQRPDDGGAERDHERGARRDGTPSGRRPRAGARRRGRRRRRGSGRARPSERSGATDQMIDRPLQAAVASSRPSRR